MGKQTASGPDAWAIFRSRLAKVYSLVATCTLLIGLVALSATLQGWMRVSFDAPGVVTVLEATKLGAVWLVSNIGEIVRVASLALLAYALFKAAMNIETIFRTVNAFNTARSPIAQLTDSVRDVRGTAEEFNRSMSSLQDAANTLSHHAPTIAELNKKLAELSDQIFQLKVDAVSRSAEAQVDSQQDAPHDPQSAQAAEEVRKIRDDEENWDELRAIWRRNIQRLESTIKDRLTGPRQRKYDNYARTNYNGIIDRLFSDNVLSGTAHEKSKELHDNFMRYKSRRRPVTNEVIGAMRILDELLDAEIKIVSGVPKNTVEDIVLDPA